MLKYKVATVSTHDEHYAKYFDKSCQKHGVAVDILGVGQKFESYATKFRLLQEYADSIEDEETIICLLDRYDIIILRPFETLMVMFNRLCENDKSKEHVYISTEEHVDLMSKEYFKFGYGLCDGRMINSGAWIMQLKTLKRLLNFYKIEKDGDDQEMMIKFVNKNRHILTPHFDGNRRFLTFPQGQMDIGFHIYYKDGELHYHNQSDKKNYKPYLIHRPAAGSMHHILNELGYGTSDVIKSGSLKRNLTIHLPRQTKQLLTNIKNIFIK